MPYKITIVRKLPPQLSSAQLSLLDFPTELLLAIFGQIQSAADLYNVARVCSRLHALALPVFLQRHDTPHPEDEVTAYVTQWDPAHEYGRYPDVLSGLGIANDITKVNRLRFFFQDPASKTSRNIFQQVFHLPYAVRRTYSFLSRLERVDRAEIYLVWDAYFTLSERSINYVPWSELKRWTSSFELMLNAIVERGCTSLTVQYDPAIKPPFQLKQGSRVIKYLSHGKDSDIHWQFERNLQEDRKALAKQPEPVAILSPSARNANCVEHLAVHSPVLFTPPFLKWTLSILRSHSRLTSLSFAYITVGADIWSAVLPLLTSALSTRLTSLSFFRNCTHLAATDLVQFLSSFPELLHLSIDRSLRSRFIDQPQRTLFSASASLCKFSKLQTLQCPVEFLTFVMGGSNPITDPLPSLRRLTVYPCTVTMSPSLFSTSKPPIFITDVLNRILDYARPEGVYCALDAQIEFKEFGSVVRLMEEQRDAINAASEASSISPSSPALIRQVFDARRQKNLPTLSFDHIRHVILFRLVVQDSERTPAAFVCHWLGVLFPKLERLTVTCRLDTHPHDDYEMKEGTRQELMRELRTACPKANTLVVAKKSYNLAQTLIA
ncbi:hypothetical protein D9619_008366 [Psilocybe cf. subviscida]|uniref:F-box domain-containing protein n=1 Tax=Psilocybe cf. subviscida TaxID=2480587 RepID=A0A8H5BA09_9AGAR|nr:hypothetical protein D9619_008366 [Psilocybe cf. subviscida]